MQKRVYADIKKNNGVKLATISMHRSPVIRENAGYIMVWTTDLYTVSE